MCACVLALYVYSNIYQLTNICLSLLSFHKVIIKCVFERLIIKTVYMFTIHLPSWKKTLCSQLYPLWSAMVFKKFLRKTGHSWSKTLNSRGVLRHFPVYLNAGCMRRTHDNHILHKSNTILTRLARISIINVCSCVS